MAVMFLRRVIFFAILVATMAGLTALMFAALAPGGWTVAKVGILLCFAMSAPWLGICAGNGLIGFAVRMLAADPAHAVLPPGTSAGPPGPERVALVMTVRHEDMTTALPPLRRLLEALPAERFTGFILSDSRDRGTVAAELGAVNRLGDALPGRIRYRRRLVNTGFKAGNVMDFCDRLADGFDFAVMLDADSVMSATAVLRLCGILHASPALGIVQHLTAGLPATSAFTRLFQFGMRSGMRIWATGQAWWQGDCGPYWGHNAIIRIAPFRRHARLSPLPGGRHILSHDQVEAAQLRAAGWGVAVWADDEGSLEANPPALPEFVHRDNRWMAGNLQYRHLLGRPGFAAMGRWQLAQAILLFAGAPLFTLMLLLAGIEAATGNGQTPSGAAAAAILAWVLAVYSPKLLGYLEILLSRTASDRYGGRVRFAMGVAAEIGFTLLLDGPMGFGKTLGMVRLLLGAPAGWSAQNRAGRLVGWGEAWAMFWPHTVFGVTVFALLLSGSVRAALWALPFAGGLLLAIPLCVWSAHAGGGWLAATPEELGARSPGWRTGPDPGHAEPAIRESLR